MSHPLKSSIGVQGHLRVIARKAATGEIVRRISIRNTITYKALDALVRLIAQVASDDAEDHAIASLRVGTGTTTPVRSNIALEAFVHTIPLLDVNKVLTVSDPFELKVLATLEAGTNADVFNNITISEAGLFTGVGNLFARQVHPGISKTPALVIDYDWRVAFTA